MGKKIYGLSLFFLLGIMIACEKEETSNTDDLPKEYEGWTLVWNDEFNDAEINANNWTYELGDGTNYGLPAGWGNNEKQIYTDNSENSRIVNDEGISALAITAIADHAGGFTSAKLTTQNLFSTRFGRIEVKVKMPEGQGLLPAIWMLGVNKSEINWPGCGEIDIMEMPGHQSNKMYSTLHYTNSENKHAEKQEAYTLPLGDFSESYHVVSLDWTPDSLTFSLDGNSFPAMTIEDDMKEYLRSAYLILNVAVGGNWPGEPDETTIFPQTMFVDYVRVYSRDDLQLPEEPALDIAEETVGQLIEPSLGDHAIKDNFTELGSLTVLAYGPGEPEISSSDTAINGDKSLVFDFPGNNWGGAYILLDSAKNISGYAALKFSLNKPDSYVNSEIKLEAGASNAIVFLKDYAGTAIADGFVEFTIPLDDFVGLNLQGITIPFSIWNPKDAGDAFFKGKVLIDNIYFE
jgi:beta-glucanase (GH16 family)